MIEESIQTGLGWTVFESNDPTLWMAITQSVSLFLTSLWQQGALVGSTAADAFGVTCDASNNPPQQVLDGYVNVDVTLVLDAASSPVALSITLPNGGGS